MINGLIEVSLRHRFLIIVGFLLIGGWGYWALLTTPLDGFYPRPAWPMVARYAVHHLRRPIPNLRW